MCRRVLVCVVLLVPAYLSAFNLNTRHVSVFQDPDLDAGSYFGFSVALRKYNGRSWLIVGAPRKNDSRQLLHEPGNVFQCGLLGKAQERCSRLDLDNYGNVEFDRRKIHHKKDHAWVGAAIDVHSNGRTLVACAPRWKNQFHKSDYLINGLCYWTDTSTSNLEQQLIPLSNTSRQGFEYKEEGGMILNYYVYGEAGMSVHVPKDSNELIIGAPGVLEWKGTVIRYKDSWRSEPQVPNPLRMQQLEYEGYFGYSVSSGHFYRNETGHQYVGAAPRSEFYKGTVWIFKYNDQGGFNEEKGITLLSKLVGEQMGEYFGASLAVLDMNGDGLDDIAVGAPMHSFFDVDEHSYDLGQAYVFINKDKGEWATPILLKESQKPGSRFGSALANLGDINRDGYEDLAVGAPYEYGGGAVYIFLGSATGLDLKPSQTLFGKDFEHLVPIQSFGISIARGFDVDQNYYNDVAIGAYDTGAAVVLRTHPVAKFIASLNTNSELISHIDDTTITVTGCIAYQGYKVAETLKANLTMKIDDRQRRAILTEYNDVTHDFQMELKRNVTSCKTFLMAIKNGTQDIQRPIQLEMMYGLAYNPLDAKDDTMCSDCPVLNPNEPKSVRKQVRFATGCRNDVCETDLKVDVEVPEIGDRGYLVLGNMSKLTLKVTAKNLGEPAFATELTVAYPRTIERIRTLSTCTANDDPADSIIRLICKLGNPFKAKAEKTLDFGFNLQDVPAEMDTLLINVTISSLSKEINEEDNQHLVHIKILQIADVTISGTSGREQIDYLYPNKSFIEDLTFTHTYEAWNLGPSPVSLVELNFWIPIEYLTKKGNVASVFEIYNPKPTLISPSGNKSFDCKFPNGQFIRDPSESSGTGELIPPHGFGEDHLNLPTDLENDLNQRRQRRAARNPTVETHSNRTLYINCSAGGENYLCGLITCRTGPLLADTYNSRAVVTFKMKAMLHKIDSELDQKNVIIVGTRGDVIMINPPPDVQPKDHREDTTQVTTMLLGKVPEGSVASWIIIISILIGLLILLIITTAMHKAGFFKRQKKEEMEAMMQESDEPNGDVPDNIADTEPITP